MDRVIEIGLYKPTFTSFISPYESQWVPGFRIEDKFNGTTNIFLNTYGAIAELEYAITLAEAEGLKQIFYRGSFIDIDEAKRAAVLLGKTLAEMLSE